MHARPSHIGLAIGSWIALLFALPPAVSAQPDELAERARLEFRQGVRAAERGDYRAALVHYRKSNALKPHPRTMYNLGAVAEHLGEDEEALGAYRNFVAAATDHEADLLGEVQQKVAALERELQATFQLTSTPPGASVRVDGSPRAAGTTPIRLKLAPGRHVLVLEISGREPTRVEVEVRPRIDQQRAVVLPVPSRLRLHAAQAGTHASVDGRALGALPSGDAMPLVHEVMPGEHEIVARSADGADVRRTVVASDREQLDLEISPGRARSTRSKLICGSLLGAAVVTALVGGIGWGLPALEADSVDGGRAEAKAHVADVFYGGAAVLAGAAVVGWVITRPTGPTIEVRRAPLVDR